MQHASGAAVSTLLKMMVDPNSPASSRVRAADCILDHATKGLELQDIEARVSQLERSVPASKSGHFGSCQQQIASDNANHRSSQRAGRDLRGRDLNRLRRSPWCACIASAKLTSTQTSQSRTSGARRAAHRWVGRYASSAGINRHVVGNERVLQERRKRIHLGPESCGGHRERSVEA